MGLFSVKPENVADVQRQLALHKVGDEAERLGYNDHFFYKPLPADRFLANSLGYVVVSRLAFSVERSILGRSLRMSESALGQAAILKTSEEEDGQQLAIVIPVKESILAPTTQTLVTAELPGTVEDGVLHSAIASAILDIVHGQTANI